MASESPSAPKESTGSLVWFITGCSSGFGKLVALEALKRGERVIATVRANLERLDDLKAAGAHIMQCDVTVPFAEMQEVARVAEGVYGQVDVVFNNAGYGHLGTLEEVGPDGLLEQYKANVFGVANVTSAFLPYLRARRAGTIVVTGSRSGLRILPFVGSYGTSKAAVNAYGETLALEVAPFGIRVLTLIPGGFYTDGKSGTPDAPPNHIKDYEPMHEQFRQFLSTFSGTQPGDVQKYAPLVLDVIRGEGLMRDKDGALRPWPGRLFIGSDAIVDMRKLVASWEKSVSDYGDLVESTDRKS